MSRVIADIHCHPGMKPYAKTLEHTKPGVGTCKKHNISYSLSRTGWRKLANRLLGFTRFTQTDPTSLKRGGVNIIFAAIYPMEKEFSRAKPLYKKNRLIEYLFNLPTGLGVKKIRDIRNMQKGYFTDAMQEYHFFEAHNGSRYLSGDREVHYQLVNDCDKLKLNSSGQDTFTINVFTTIEGGHSLYSNYTDIGKDTPEVRADVLGNIEAIKNWQYPPVFITLAHHFWNGLCGHTESIPQFFEKFNLVSQQLHLDDGISDLGKEVIRRFLSSRNKRILIDIKHMSHKARQEYFNMLDNEFADESIPVIASHAGVRGNSRNAHLFYDESISFSDEEIVRIGKSKGLFGIQLDKSRVASSKEIRKYRKCFTKKQVLRHTSLLVWRQLLHIAQVLDRAGLCAWETQCVGSDFDGIVNPVNGVWTAAEYDDLQTHLLLHAKVYISSEAFSQLRLHANRHISAEEIINKFMGGNVLGFLYRRDMDKELKTTKHISYNNAACSKEMISNNSTCTKSPAYV